MVGKTSNLHKQLRLDTWKGMTGVREMVGRGGGEARVDWRGMNAPKEAWEKSVHFHFTVVRTLAWEHPLLPYSNEQAANGERGSPRQRLDHAQPTIALEDWSSLHPTSATHSSHFHLLVIPQTHHTSSCLYTSSAIL